MTAKAKSEEEQAVTVKTVPDGYHTLTPYLVVRDAAKVLEFLRHGLGGEVVHPPVRRSDGRIMHAEVRVGDSMVMLGEPMGDSKPMQASVVVYVDDADATYRRALQAGGVSLKEPEDQFYGDRTGAVKDPAGDHWWIATHIEDVPAEG